MNTSRAALVGQEVNGQSFFTRNSEGITILSAVVAFIGLTYIWFAAMSFEGVQLNDATATMPIDPMAYVVCGVWIATIIFVLVFGAATSIDEGRGWLYGSIVGSVALTVALGIYAVNYFVLIDRVA